MEWSFPSPLGPFRRHLSVDSANRRCSRHSGAAVDIDGECPRSRGAPLSGSSASSRHGHQARRQRPTPSQSAGVPRRRGRARSRAPSRNAAFFELFLHEVFRRLDLAPEVHPAPRSGQGHPHAHEPSQLARARSAQVPNSWRKAIFAPWCPRNRWPAISVRRPRLGECRAGVDGGVAGSAGPRAAVPTGACGRGSSTAA